MCIQFDRSLFPLCLVERFAVVGRICQRARPSFGTQAAVELSAQGAAAGGVCATAWAGRRAESEQPVCAQQRTFHSTVSFLLSSVM